MTFSHYRIFINTLVATATLIVVKYILHQLGLEIIQLGTLHGSLLSGAIFVIGFLMSATIADYKEAERIPAEVSAAFENMNEDVTSIHANYPQVDLAGYQTQLQKALAAFESDVRSSKSHSAKAEIHDLSQLNAQLETAGVPANFIVKLKQQQATVLRHLFRVNYIQRITFIPSATILAWSIVVLVVLLLLATSIEPFVAGMLLSGGIIFILVYVLQLIQVIKTPFHDEGKTKDDVSLFLLERTLEQWESEKPGPAKPRRKSAAKSKKR